MTRDSTCGVGPLVTAFLLASLLIPPALQAQGRDWDAVEITTRSLGSGVFMLQGAGGNIGLSVGEDGAFLIDDQFAPLTDKIVAAVRDAGGGDVRFVVNTHWHADHTGGNEKLGEAGAFIVAHDNVRRRMDPESFRNLVGRSQQAPEAALPVVTFSDTLTFWWNDEEIRTVHVEHAHTDGDVLIFFENADVVHMGDTFFKDRYPFIDIQSGGSVNGVIRAADMVLAASDADTHIIPGHGSLATRADLARYRDVLVTIRDRVQTLVDQGRSEDEVVAAGVSEEWDEEWGGGFINPERLARAVYQSLAGAR